MTNVGDDQAARILRGVLWLGRRLRVERPKQGHGLSAIAVMATLGRLGPMSASRLAEKEHLQPQSLTRILASLERDGCIRRQTDVRDRRAQVIELTRHGRDVVRRDMAGRRAWLAAAMEAALEPAEREALLAATDAMVRLAQFGGLDAGED